MKTRRKIEDFSIDYRDGVEVKLLFPRCEIRISHRGTLLCYEIWKREGRSFSLKRFGSFQVRSFWLYVWGGGDFMQITYTPARYPQPRTYLFKK